MKSTFILLLLSSSTILFLFLLLLLSLSPSTTTIEVVVHAQSTSSCSDDGLLLDPYSNECILSTIEESDLLEPCDEATSIAQCGCATCALPGCSGCISSTTSTTSTNDNNNNKCPSGWGTEYDDYSCASFDAGTIRDELLLLSNNQTSSSFTPTEVDILVSSGMLMRSTSAAQVNDQKYIKQKTSQDESALLFFLTSSSSNSLDNPHLVVALTWIPPVALSAVCLFVIYYLIKFA